ncbi:MAG: hypothetical protein JNJ47_06560, partial [Alphaproteobacteria bacterium]|nr:hypothetical protein [Alphaproteobacteria bacterium]
YYLGDAYSIHNSHGAAFSSFTEVLDMESEQGCDFLTDIEHALLFVKLGDNRFGGAHATDIPYQTVIHYYEKALLLLGNNENEFALLDEMRTRIRQKIHQLIVMSREIAQITHKVIPL